MRVLGTPDRFARSHDACEMGCICSGGVGQVLFCKVYMRASEYEYRISRGPVASVPVRYAPCYRDRSNVIIPTLYIYH